MLKKKQFQNNHLFPKFLLIFSKIHFGLYNREQGRFRLCIKKGVQFSMYIHNKTAQMGNKE